MVEINDNEIKEIMRRALKGMIDRNDLTGTQKATILRLATNNLESANRFCVEMLIANPNFTVEYFQERSSNYKDAKRLIDWITEEKEADQKRYFFDFENREQVQSQNLYKSFKEVISNSGFMIFETEGRKIKVYTPMLCFYFNSNELPVTDADTKEEIIIDSSKYFASYLLGYNEGIAYFEKEFAISPNILYGSNAEAYIRNIHLKYFHHGKPDENKGWQYVKSTNLFLLTQNAFKEQGFYSGIVSQVEELALNHPPLFVAFEKCTHPDAPQSLIPNVEIQPTPISQLKDLFSSDTYEKYLDALVHCSPPLLQKTEIGYKFIGNKKTQKGIVAAWFKYLKSKGIVKVSLSRVELAKILSDTIVDFSINGSTIDNVPQSFAKVFEEQLLKYINNN